MRIGIIEPHLLQFGGIRRMVELANRLVRAGHDVAFYLPPGERLACDWLPCAARIEPIDAGLDTPLDVVVFNEETQWFVPFRFTGARRRVFYALHAAWHYDKPGSWEAARAPVDYRLANSTWTADQLEAETGHRPEVLLGGIDRATFHPTDQEPRYPLLCIGDPRPWKGTHTIQAAADRLGLKLERLLGKGLPQSKLAAEFGKAEVFVVGSTAEGFCQPGLEALACGVPLVTTDNGGCREYAVHEQTALVVPPEDPEAMADAIRRLRTDAALRERLRANGLEMVSRFDWDAAGQRFGEILEGVADGRLPRPEGLQPHQRGRDVDPVVSIVLLQWDQLHHTQPCVDSIRRHTDVPYELIVVDNGSAPAAASYVEQAADVPILNRENRGFAAGMNQGLDAARGTYVVFANNDTVFPPGWASRLVDTFAAHPRAGIVVPAVTAAGNERTVRSEPRDAVQTLAPFEAPPSAVVYLMDTEATKKLGGWDEGFPVASAEDVDLCFQVWVNGLDIVLDEAVLVEHEGKGTAVKLPDYHAQWAANRKVLFDKWVARRPEIPHLGVCTAEEFERNLAIAQSVAAWMQRYFAVRDRLPRQRGMRLALRVLRPAAGAAARVEDRVRHTRLARRALARSSEDGAARRVWRAVKKYGNTRG